MSVSSGPNTVEDGLVFYYDMGNNLKSWKGKPTTNLANVGLNGMSGVSLSFLGIEDGWKKYSMSGTFTGGTYPYVLNITSVSFTGGVTYSSACYIKTNAQVKFNYFGTGMNYVNVPMNKGGTSIGVLQSDGSYYCGRSNFEYTGTTTQPGYILSNPINNTTFNAATDFVWIKEGQVELGEFPTPFAGDAATRSNTQAILDLTNNRTVTISPELTYNANNTFEFDGLNDRILVDTQYPLSWDDPFSIESVIRIPSGSDWHDTTAGSNSGTAIVGRGSYSGSHGLLRADTQTLGFWTRTDSGLYASTFSSAQYDTWYYLTGTYDGTVNSLYVNGILVSSVTVVKSGVPDTGSWQIGGGVAFGGNTGKYGKGEIPLVKIYNRALTSDEVQRNFDALRGRYGI